ncbi:hypothetical protein LINGRAHAP2_LOCUS8443 [Linum grandiflorum]
MTMSRAGVSAAIIILSFLLNDFNSIPSSVVAYDYEFNSICNGSPLKDSSPLKVVASKRSLDNVASRADSSSGVVDFCEDGSDDSGTYTMHGQGGCVAADDCSDCIARPKLISGPIAKTNSAAMPMRRKLMSLPWYLIPPRH